MGPSNEEINKELAERDNQDIKYNFVGKNVIMTGASSGIGKVIWKKLLRNGATVAAFGRNVAKLEAEVDDKMRSRGKFIPVVCDLAQPVDVEEKFYIVMSNEFEGKLDVLINSAGIMLSKDYRDTTLQEFDHIMTINVRAPMQLMSMAGPWLQETKGAVVNLSANAVPRPSCTLFSMSKSCLDMLTQCAALEMAKYGVRCNAVAPGVTNTPMRMSQPFGPMNRDQNLCFNNAMQEVTPLLNEINDKADVANCVLFLASDDASFINGQIMTVDGGTHLATQGCWIEWNAIEGNFPITEESEEEDPEAIKPVVVQDNQPRSTIGKLFSKLSFK